MFAVKKFSLSAQAITELKATLCASVEEMPADSRGAIIQGFLHVARNVIPCMCQNMAFQLSDAYEKHIIYPRLEPFGWEL